MSTRRGPAKCRIETQHGKTIAAWSRYVPKLRDYSTDGCCTLGLRAEPAFVSRTIGLDTGHAVQRSAQCTQELFPQQEARERKTTHSCGVPSKSVAESRRIGTESGMLHIQCKSSLHSQGGGRVSIRWTRGLEPTPVHLAGKSVWQVSQWRQLLFLGQSLLACQTDPPAAQGLSCAHKVTLGQARS